MSADFKLIIRSNQLPDLTPKMRQMLGQVVRKCAFDLEADAKAGAPVDTGALRNSIHVGTANTSTYEAAATAVRSINPKAKLFPPLPNPPIMSAFVAVGVEYGAYLEYGTVRATAQPFFIPAVDRMRPIFIKRCAEAVRRAAAGGTAMEAMP